MGSKDQHGPEPSKVSFLSPNFSLDLGISPWETRKVRAPVVFQGSDDGGASPG